MLLEKKIPARYFLEAIQWELSVIILLSLIIKYITGHIKHFLPEMPLSIPAFLGTAISILLSFKLSQSYDRWWEARKAWGAIVNDSRTLVMQLQTLVKGPDAGGGTGDMVRRVAYRQIAWCYVLGRSLRGQDALMPEGGGRYLTEGERAAAGGHVNKPLAILQMNTFAIRELRDRGQIDAYSHIQLDSTLVRLCESMGRTERINNTIFPSTYRMLLHFIIYLFVLTLSIALKDVDAFFEIPLMILISSCFFLLEKTAYQLKDPFRNRPSDTSVTAIARTIEINILQLLGETDIPGPVEPGSFYIM